MEAPEEQEQTESPEVTRWQARLLPYMIGVLIALALIFFIASGIQLYYLHCRIEDSPKLRLKQTLDQLKDDGTGTVDMSQLDYIRWKTLSMLEGYALERRYHQANVSLMTRTWIRYLGFVTGMILSLVGATFILGKLRETETKLDARGPLRVAVTTASPGIVLAVLGTVLMVTTMVTHFEIQVTDSPLYTQSWLGMSLLSGTQRTGENTERLEKICAELEEALGLKETAPDDTSRSGGTDEKLQGILSELERELGLKGTPPDDTQGSSSED